MRAWKMTSLERIARAELTGFELRRSQWAEPWAKMSGSDRLKRSKPCGHFRYNPQGLNEIELLSLIWFREGVKPSVLFLRADGKIQVARCQGGRSKQVMKLALPVGASMVVMSLLFSLMG